MATLIDALVYSVLLSLMAFGLTFIRRTTGVWNVAQAGIVTLGAYTILTGISFIGGSPYFYLPFAVIMGALLGAIIFLTAIEPLRTRKASPVIMLVATIAFNLLLLGVLNIYADLLQEVFKISSKNFVLTRLDFRIFHQPAIVFISLIALILLIVGLYLFMQKTRTGLALRASVEQPRLATVMGVNVRWLHLLSWAIACGSAGLAGGGLCMRIQCNPGIGGSMIAILFCVSILGGVGEIYGPLLGGFLVGFVQIYGTTLLARAFGPWVIPYKGLLPMIILILTLLFIPEGLSGIHWRKTLEAVSLKHTNSERRTE